MSFSPLIFNACINDGAKPKALQHYDQVLFSEPKFHVCVVLLINMYGTVTPRVQPVPSVHEDQVPAGI